MKKVRAIINYLDKELKKDIKVGEEYEVTDERAEVLLKGNPSSKNKPFVEVVEELQEDQEEVVVEEPKKKTTKKVAAEEK